MVYCVIVVLLLAFNTAVCSNEVSSIDKIFMKICLYFIQRNLTKKDSSHIVYKDFCCNISQQVILQNTFSIFDLSCR